jgi:hypothetical protein
VTTAHLNGGDPDCGRSLPASDRKERRYVDAGLERVTQAGGQPISWVSLACELQRDWARTETVPAIVDIVLTDRLTKE